MLSGCVKCVFVCSLVSAKGTFHCQPLLYTAVRKLTIEPQDVTEDFTKL